MLTVVNVSKTNRIRYNALAVCHGNIGSLHSTAVCISPLRIKNWLINAIKFPFDRPFCKKVRHKFSIVFSCSGYKEAWIMCLLIYNLNCVSKLSFGHEINIYKMIWQLARSWTFGCKGTRKLSNWFHNGSAAVTLLEIILCRYSWLSKFPHSIVRDGPVPIWNSDSKNLFCNFQENNLYVFQI